MGFKKYRGPIETVEHALMAHIVVTLTCQSCRRSRRKWAWRIYQQAGDAVQRMRLNKPFSGFYCTGCRRNVEVVTVADSEWAYVLWSCRAIGLSDWTMQSKPLQTSNGLPRAILRAARMAWPSDNWISVVTIAGKPEA